MAIIGLQKGSGKNVDSQGKVSEKSGNFDMDNEWQPCRSPLLCNHSSESIHTLTQLVLAGVGGGLEVKI